MPVSDVRYQLPYQDDHYQYHTRICAVSYTMSRLFYLDCKTNDKVQR